MSWTRSFSECFEVVPSWLAAAVVVVVGGGSRLFVVLRLVGVLPVATVSVVAQLQINCKYEM